MKIKVVLIIAAIVLMMVNTPLSGKKVAVLEEVSRPDMMAMGDGRLYIQERANIYVFDLKDYKLITRFGKEGEGPKEFKIPTMGAPLLIFPLNGKLYISSHAKVSVFDKSGKYITESRVPPFQVYRPYGDGYVYTGTVTDEKKINYLAVNLCDGKFNKTKELYVSDMQVGMNFKWTFPFNTFTFDPYKEKLYLVAGKEGFVINVYDKKGTLLKKIKKEYEKLKVPEQYKKNTLNWFKTSPKTKNFWNFFKDRIAFRDQFPEIQASVVESDLIYVITHNRKGDDVECIVLDLEGNEKKRLFLTIPETYGNDFAARYTFYNKVFYRLVENEDEENWELHSTPIF